MDLTTEQAKQQMLRLADTADVVLEAFRPGTMEKLGLGLMTCALVTPT